MFQEKIKITIIFIEIITISSNFCFCEIYIPFISKSKKPPDIWLSSFQQTDSFEDILVDYQFRISSDFENEFIHKFNKTDYIIQDDTRQVTFICQANYPVMWYVPHFKQVENVAIEMFKIDNVRVASFNNQLPFNKDFRTSLTINFDVYNPDIFSVNFTCGSPKAKEFLSTKSFEYKSSSIHIYYSETSKSIESYGQTIPIKISKNYVHDKLTIPCRPSLPNMQVKLENQVQTKLKSIKVDQVKTKWREIQNLTFDPKYGITVQKNSRVSIFGLYKCTIFEEGNVFQNGEQRVILFNVTFDNTKFPNPRIEDINFEPTLNLKGDALVMYGDNKLFGESAIRRNITQLTFENNDLLCCSGMENNGPVIYRRTCTNPMQCEILKRSMEFKVMIADEDGYTYINYGHSSNDPNDCVSTNFYGENSVVFCKGENVKFGDYLIKLFNKDILPISKRKEQVERLRIWTFEPESSKAATNVSRRIFMTVGHPVKKTKDYQYDVQFTEFVQSDKSQWVDITFDYLDDNEQHIRSSQVAFERKVDTQYVAEYNRDYFYVGEPIIPICLGWLSFYCRGAFVRVLFANGTSMILNKEEKDEPSKYVTYFSEGLNAESYHLGRNYIEHKFGKQVIAQKDVIAFECWMPQWNTEKWDKLEFELKILEPTKPSFLESVDQQETTVYFYLGNEYNKLEWRIIGGSPDPIVDLRKDGKEVFNVKFESLDQFYLNSLDFEKFNLTVERKNQTDDKNSTAELLIVNILFPKATHEVQGLYECTVTNVGGTITKRFNVIATEANCCVWLFVVVITISILLVVIFTGLFVKNWKLKYKK